MLSATATWKNGTTCTEWFFYEAERIVWIAELKASCKDRDFTTPEITLGDDSGEPRKKIWGRIGMSAEITEREFNLLKGGYPMDEVAFRNLFEAGRFRPDGDTYFPETSDNDAHIIEEEINMDL